MRGRGLGAAATVAATDLVLDAIAVARLTRLLQIDEVWPVQEARDAYERWAGDSRWAALSSCPWCLGTWVAAGAVLARHLCPRTWRVASRILAGSAAAGLLSRIVDG